jgi:large subunit ribosomal protein L24
MSKLKIKRGDNVIITTGKKDIKGKTGEVIEVIKKEGKDPRVIVAGLNIVKKHVKPISFKSSRRNYRKGSFYSYL